jgi:hypothetical protein
VVAYLQKLNALEGSRNMLIVTRFFSCLLHQTFAHTASQMTGKQSIDRVEWAEKPDFEH